MSFLDLCRCDPFLDLGLGETAGWTIRSRLQIEQALKFTVSSSPAVPAHTFSYYSASLSELVGKICKSKLCTKVILDALLNQLRQIQPAIDASRVFLELPLTLRKFRVHGKHCESGLTHVGNGKIKLTVFGGQVARTAATATEPGAGLYCRK